MALDPGRWPEMPPDEQYWAAQLRGAAQTWSEEGRRLRSMVHTPALSGPCARALWACADRLAAEIDLVAGQLAAAAAGLDRSARGGRP